MERQQIPSVGGLVPGCPGTHIRFWGTAAVAGGPKRAARGADTTLMPGKFSPVPESSDLHACLTESLTTPGGFCRLISPGGAFAFVVAVVVLGRQKILSTVSLFKNCFY